MKTAIIIGAGIGGLCTGIRLLAQGYHVRVFEKNNVAGGVVTRIATKDRAFSWEESASIAINPIEYEQIFVDVGRNPKDYFQWIPLKSSYKVFYEDGRQITFPNHLDQMLETVNNHFPEDLRGYKEFLCMRYKAYEIAKSNLLNQRFDKLSMILNPQTLYYVYQMHTLQNANYYLNQVITDRKLKEPLLFQTFFMGVSPYRIPSIYTTVAEQSQVEGIWHIKGGLSAYKMALVELFEELGGKIFYKHKVERVVKENKVMKGIYIGDQYIAADLVVVNADYRYAMKKLLNIQLRRRYENSCSVCVIHLGISKHYEELDVHNLYINQYFKKEIERVFSGKLPQAPNLYIYSPSKVDDSFCKDPRNSSVNIMVRVPSEAGSFKPVRWSSQTKDKVYRACIKSLKQIKGLEDIENHIVARAMTIPTTFKEGYNYTGGSCFGIAHTLFQSMLFRPQLKLRTYKNLYFVGSSIHPGNGVSIVMIGAKLVADTIINEMDTKK